MASGIDRALGGARERTAARGGHGRRRRRLYPYLLLAPVILVLLAVNIYPLISSLGLSLTDYNLANAGVPARFVGLGNFQQALGDAEFLKSLLTTGEFVGVSITVEFVLGFGLALLLSRPVRGQGFFRTALVVPMIISPLIVGLLWRFMYNYDVGLINTVLAATHLPRLNLLGNPGTALLAVIITDVWQWTPLVFLLLFSGLQGLPEEPFEAARIDGASAVQTLRYLTVPLLRPIIAIALILRGMDALREYDKIYAMTGGGPGSATETISYYIYRQGFVNLNLGYAAALSYILLAIVIVLVTALVRTQLRFDEAER